MHTKTCTRRFAASLLTAPGTWKQVTDAQVHPDSGLLSYTKRSTIRPPEMLSTREAVHLCGQEARGTAIILPT